MRALAAAVIVVLFGAGAGFGLLVIYAALVTHDFSAAAITFGYAGLMFGLAYQRRLIEKLRKTIIKLASERLPR